MGQASGLKIDDYKQKCFKNMGLKNLESSCLFYFLLQMEIGAELLFTYYSVGSFSGTP